MKEGTNITESKMKIIRNYVKIISQKEFTNKSHYKFVPFFSSLLPQDLLTQSLFYSF